MGLDILNPVILKDHKPKGGFCVTSAKNIDDVNYSYVDFDFGLDRGTEDGWWQLVDLDGYKADFTYYNGGIYRFGGGTYSGASQEQSFRYTIASNTVTSVWGDSIDRAGHMTCYYQPTNRFYMFGGHTGEGYTTEVAIPRVSWQLTNNLVQGDWNAETNLPETRLGSSGGLIGDKMYIYGGFLSTNTTGTVWSTPHYDMVVYDLSNHTFTEEGFDNSFIPNESVVDPDNNLLWAPSYTSTSSTEMDVRYCDLSAYTWTVETVSGIKPSARKNHTLSYYNGNLYMVGGEPPLGGAVKNEIWAYNIQNNRWVPLYIGDALGGEFGSSIIVNGYLYVAPGGDGSSIIPSFWRFNLSKDSVMAIRIARGL